MDAFKIFDDFSKPSCYFFLDFKVIRIRVWLINYRAMLNGNNLMFSDKMKNETPLMIGITFGNRVVKTKWMWLDCLRDCNRNKKKIY
ncbi:hypothetical protein BpHYR1_005556 [Brachionus plicatilis]|uniref:Uncharacterized protein n=1 Tax=Brachionus plicatilis TaxID=10195 RepID=A0A3M7SGM1_BRAPC|nr:hypothetical protein BpHYR1_005556 [Brachionus plicatilis]